jgi:hypothetical protein
MQLRLSIGLIIPCLCASWSVLTAQVLYTGEAYVNARYYSSKGPWPDTQELEFYFNDRTTRIDPATLPALTDSFSIACEISFLPDSFVIGESKFSGTLMEDSQYFAVNRSHYLEIQKVDNDSLLCLFRFGSFSQSLEPKDGGGHELIQRWSLTIGRYIMHATPSSVRSSEEPQLSCYPNPANDLLTIRGLGGGHVTIGIYALSGSQIISKTSPLINDTYTIDISMLSPGMYMAIISGAGGINVLKFCKL